MAAIKEKFSSVKIDVSGITLIKDDGETSFIPITNITEFTFGGSISDEYGDQSFFDDFDQQGIEPETQIVFIAKYWKRDYIDFNKARSAMSMAIVSKGGFSNLTDFEKLVVSRWFLATYEQRITVITNEQDRINWDFIVKYTKMARDKRIEKSRRDISYTLYPTDSNNLFDTVGSLITAYSIANKSDLIDWFNNTVGTQYENNGFAQKSYFSQDLLDSFNDVIKNGNYE